jgi:adenosine deaminase
MTIDTIRRQSESFAKKSKWRAFPKVELHRHLEGALRLETVVELAPQVGIDLPHDPKKIREHFLVETPMTDLGSVLRKFLHTQKVLHSEEVLQRIAFEAVEDAFNEGIRILELRYAPTFIAAGHSHLNFHKIHRAIHRGLEKATAKYPIKAGLIFTFQRSLTKEENKKALKFAIESADSFIGFDLADDEAAAPAKDFAGLFSELQKLNKGITIHAGEANSPNAPQNVLESIQYLGARRIGHGLQIIHSPEIIKIVADKKIPLEICPFSNYLTRAIPDLKSHPINALKRAGVLITVNSDDPGIFGMDLTHEYDLLANDYGWTEKDFEEANLIAARASFIPDAEIFWSQLKN